MLFLTFFSKKFHIYLLEFNYKLRYNVLMFLLSLFTCYFYKTQLIFLLSEYFLENITSKRFFFSNITQIVWIYIKISINLSFIISLPFVLWNTFIFFITALHKNECIYLIKVLKSYSFIYLLILFLDHTFLIPNILKFFIFFDKTNLYFPLHFEAKFEEYFIFIFSILNSTLILVTIPLIIYLTIYNQFFNKKFFIENKKKIYILMILINAFFSPPDIYFQIISTLMLILILEISLLLYILFLTKSNI